MSRPAAGDVSDTIAAQAKRLARRRAQGRGFIAARSKPPVPAGATTAGTAAVVARIRAKAAQHHAAGAEQRRVPSQRGVPAARKRPREEGRELGSSRGSAKHRRHGRPTVGSRQLPSHHDGHTVSAGGAVPQDDVHRRQAVIDAVNDGSVGSLEAALAGSSAQAHSGKAAADAVHAMAIFAPTGAGIPSRHATSCGPTVHEPARGQSTTTAPTEQPLYVQTWICSARDLEVCQLTHLTGTGTGTSA